MSSDLKEQVDANRDRIATAEVRLDAMEMISEKRAMLHQTEIALLDSLAGNANETDERLEEKVYRLQQSINHLVDLTKNQARQIDLLEFEVELRAAGGMVDKVLAFMALAHAGCTVEQIAPMVKRGLKVADKNMNTERIRRLFTNLSEEDVAGLVRKVFEIEIPDFDDLKREEEAEDDPTGVDPA